LLRWMKSMNYSPDQQAALQTMQQWLNDPSASVYVLTGSAGTGKTTVIKEILNLAYLTNREVVATAMTHRAADVLEDAIGIKTHTTHSAFGLSPSLDVYGRETFKPTGASIIGNNQLIVVDEASMVGNNLLNVLAKIIKGFRSKILFVGDPYQLPPIAQRCSVFDGTLPTSELVTVHRQSGGNPILDKAIEFREYLEERTNVMPDITETELTAEGHGIHVMNKEDFTTSFVKSYLNYEAGDEVTRPLCTYTNKSAVEYNSLIRKSLFFLQGTIEPYYPGELLISNSIVKQEGKTLLKNNEKISVLNYKPTKLHGLNGHLVKVKRKVSKNSRNPTPIVFVPQDQDAAKAEMDKLQKLAKAQQDFVNSLRRKLEDVPPQEESRRTQYWRTFFALKDSLADLRPPFAGTTHKAQGGTYPAVYIDMQNIKNCRNPKVQARLMYVALTRAQEEVFILNKESD
jgi:exodeoxyribonuclease-5